MKLGSLSEKYESNGNPGAYNNGEGDKGGQSYGLYQLSLNTGALKGYVHYSKYSNEFKGLLLGSSQFNAQWQQLALLYPEEFAEDQYQYQKHIYYTPVRNQLDSIGIPQSNAINQVIWSTSTQHGPRWAVEAFKKAKPRERERDIIKAIYELRAAAFKNSTYYNSSTSRRRIRDNVLKRYESELKEALELVNKR
jgi:hypothetical protein